MNNKKKFFSVLAMFVLVFTIFSFSKYSFASCPGDGLAKPVSSVEILTPYLDDYGNTILIIKVMGYGRDFVRLAGNKINYFSKEPIVLTCTGADGFYYKYNCGKLNPNMGYVVEAKFTSDNFPYTVKTARKSI